MNQVNRFDLMQLKKMINMDDFWVGGCINSKYFASHNSRFDYKYEFLILISRSWMMYYIEGSRSLLIAGINGFTLLMRNEAWEQIDFK